MFKIKIPEGTQEEYLKIAERINIRVLIAVSYFSVIVEMLNIARVLFFF